MVTQFPEMHRLLKEAEKSFTFHVSARQETLSHGAELLDSLRRDLENFFHRAFLTG